MGRGTPIKIKVSGGVRGDLSVRKSAGGGLPLRNLSARHFRETNGDDGMSCRSSFLFARRVARRTDSRVLVRQQARGRTEGGAKIYGMPWL
jgi:hypothetical protein